jgi:hypothetical protein
VDILRWKEKGIQLMTTSVKAERNYFLGVTESKVVEGKHIQEQDRGRNKPTDIHIIVG